MNKVRIVVILAMIVVSIILALTTTYFYGQFFSHPRYWEGTIERVSANQAEFIKAAILDMERESSIPSSPKRLERMFLPLNNNLIVEIHKHGTLVWSNMNPRYVRGDVLQSLKIKEGKTLTISRYRPPAWNYLFARWAKNPMRWPEPSFDYITFPFIWFATIYFMLLVATALVIKSAYLEKDILQVFRKLEERYPR